MPCRIRRPAFSLTVLLWFIAAGWSRAQELAPPGRRPEPPEVHALTNAKVVVKPGTTIEPCTIVLRDGLIEAVGAEVAVPPDARVWDLKGMTVYAGLIDPALSLGGTSGGGGGGRNDASGPRAADSGFHGVPGDQPDPGNPGPGSGVAKITPERRVADGYAPDAKTLESLRELGFTSANIVPPKGVLRGTGCFVVLADGDPNRAILKRDVFQHAVFETSGWDDDSAAFPSSLMATIAAIRQALLDADFYARDQAHYLAHPAERKRPAFNPAMEALQPALKGEIGVVFNAQSVLEVDYATRLAKEFNLRFVILGSGQEWRRPELARAAGATMILPVTFTTLPKLPDEDDWTQVSLDLLRMWDWAPENPALVRGLGVEVALTTQGLHDRGVFRKYLSAAIARGLTNDDALAALTTVPARLCGMDSRLGTIEKGKIANLTVVDGNGYFDPEAKVKSVWIDGRVYRIKPGEEEKKDEAKKDQTEEEKQKAAKAKEEADKKKADLQEVLKKRVARPTQADHGPTEQPPAVLVRGATLWTCGPGGKIEKGDLLCVGGKIRGVGQSITVPAELQSGLLEIGGKGMHVTPGLIDCHSHAMITGDVNEGTLPSSAMVRIGDVVNSETDNIYEQLAGGLTVANLFHGSANPIGGHSCVIKLRDGAAPEDLKFAGAFPGIKFALGENVKQSNWGEKFTTRFPQTRMGVKTFIQNRFIAAREYLAQLEAARASGSPASVRRDLELEALGEVLTGHRLIHCHSYRQDEILMLIRLMDSFGVKIGTFQHILEGYKVADEMAKHGVGGSCFTDWWAYKFEVYDAIPYAGAIMHQRGVLTSFNSDSGELARRMYLEAAKAVKYGGIPEQEALNFVTIYPARQLRIDTWVGTLEVGKDADFAVWTTSPLDSSTVCLQTWIDGKKYFDRVHDAARTAGRNAEWAALREKAKKIGDLGGGGAGNEGRLGGMYFETAQEHRHDGIWDVDCMGPFLRSERGHGEGGE